MFIINGYLEGSAERVGVRAASGVFTVDGFNGDAAKRLKFPLEKMMQDTQILLHLRVVARHIQVQRLAIPLGCHDNSVPPIDEVRTRNTLGEGSFDGVKLDTAQ